MVHINDIWTAQLPQNVHDIYNKQDPNTYMQIMVKMNNICVHDICLLFDFDFV